MSSSNSLGAPGSPEEIEIYAQITPPDSAKSFQDVRDDIDFIKLARAQLVNGGPCFDFEQPLYGFSDGKFQQTGKTFHLLEACTRQPVVLVFGSYTCGIFRRAWPPVHDLWKKYGDRLTFVTVYIAEMHPTDGWETIDNRAEGILFAQPTSFEQREVPAAACARHLNIEMPVVLDPMDNRIAQAYGALPNRLYLIAADGTIAFQGERGPQGYKPEVLEDAIKTILG